MPDQWHPILAEDGELPDDAQVAAFMEEARPKFEFPEPGTTQPVAESMQPTGEEAPSPEPAPAEQSAPAYPPPPSEEDLKYWKIRREDAYAEIARLAEMDETFRQRGGEVFGRKAKREAQARISELEAVIENLRREKELAEVRQMEPTEIDRRYAEDGDFARRYTELVHGEPVSVQEVAEQQYYRNTAEDILEQGKLARMADARIEEYKSAFTYCTACRTNQHGFYDHAADGRLFIELYQSDSVARKAAFDRFRDLFTAEATALKTANERLAARPPAQPQQQAFTPPAASQPAQDDGAGAPNPKLQIRPDTTTSGVVRPTAGTAKYNHEDLMKNYSWDQLIEMFPNDGDYERAVEQGIVTLSAT